MQGTLENSEDGGLHYEIKIREMVPPLTNGLRYTATIANPTRESPSTGKTEPITGANLHEHWGRTLDEAISEAQADLDEFRK